MLFGKISYTTAAGIPMSLSNLYYRNESSVIEIQDAIEDASTAEEVRDNLNKLNLFEKFEIDRKTDRYIRLKSKDCFGNTHYLKVIKEV